MLTPLAGHNKELRNINSNPPKEMEQEDLDEA